MNRHWKISILGEKTKLSVREEKYGRDEHRYILRRIIIEKGE